VSAATIDRRLAFARSTLVLKGQVPRMDVVKGWLLDETS